MIHLISSHVQDLAAEDYRISYLSGKFTERDHYVTIENGTNRSISLYLLSTGNSTDTTITVTDENAREVENATIKMLRYFSEDNLYTTVAMSRTDSSGKSKMNLEQFNAFYYFIIDKGAKTILTTSPSRVIDAALSYTGFIGEDILESRRKIQFVSHELTFTNSTQVVRFVYNDPNNLVDEGCLLVERITPKETEVICDRCLKSTAGTLICTINTTKEGSHRAYDCDSYIF